MVINWYVSFNDLEGFVMKKGDKLFNIKRYSSDYESISVRKDVKEKLKKFKERQNLTYSGSIEELLINFYNY